MRLRFPLRAAALVTVALACSFGLLGRASACAYHGGGSGSSIVHPGSIDVAIAVQIAADAGTIDAESVTAPAVSMVAYHRMVKQIERFRSLLEAAGKRSAPAFSLLLVESALWSRFTPEPAGIALAIHTAGPDQDEPVILSAGLVIRSVLEGRLSAADALHRGLIRVEAPIDAKLALFDLLAAAPERFLLERNRTAR